MSKCTCSDDELRFVGCHCGAAVYETAEDVVGDNWVDEFLGSAPAPAKAPKTPHQILGAGLSKLSEKDRTFAMSLLRSTRPSEKQLYWIGKLAERVSQPAAPVESQGGFLPICELLQRASGALQRPKLLVQAGELTLRLTIAGPRSQAPGSVNVTAAEATEVDPVTGQSKRDWYGRITEAGNYQPSARHPQTAILAALKAVAADPAGAAKLYGQKTGACCFCGRELTDGASIYAGYGPRCAEHFNLPWGEDGGIKGGYRKQPTTEETA